MSEEVNDMTVGSKIFELRKKWNLSQEELAERVHVSRQTVSKWENDVVLPDVYNLKELAKVFQCTVDELIDDAKEVHTKQDGPVVEAMKYSGKLVKRHWQKVGYYLLYVALGCFLFTFIVNMMSGGVETVYQSMGFGHMFGEHSTHHGMESIFDMNLPGMGMFKVIRTIPLIAGVVSLIGGIGLIVYDFIKMKDAK